MPTYPNQRAITVKKGHFRNQCHLLKKQREQTENNQNDPGNKNSAANTSNPNSNVNNNNNPTKTVTKLKESQKLFTHPVRHAEKTNHSTEKGYFVANAADRPPPRHRRPERQNQVSERANQSDTNEAPQAAAQNLN